MPSPSRRPSRYRDALAVLAPLLLTGAVNGAETATSLHWTARDHRGGERALERTSVCGREAIRLDADKQTPIDLTASYPWRERTGPMTIRVLFEPTHHPREKVPILSKWLLEPGRRSFEIGLLSDGRPFFDATASGSWNSEGRELVGTCRLLPDEAYALAAVFEPGSRMALYVNGRLCGEVRDRVPARLHANDTPVLLGAQPPGGRWADLAIATLWVDPRALSAEELAAWSGSLGLTELPTLVGTPVRDGRMDLAQVRRDVMAYCRSLEVEGKPYGVLKERALPDSPVTLYATCDVAWIRACMGEDLTRSLSAEERGQWIDHIHSYAAEDGSYPGGRHSLEHANGMVIGALAVLDGRQKRPVALYEAFDEPDEIGPWLERIRWDRQWSASHLFWGGMHCYSMSRRASDAWRERVFDWLDSNLDPETGWWRKGVPQAGLPIEVLGGAAHIWPIYQHHRRPFPYPRQVIDSILALQRADGSWLGFGNYMELDALYGLAFLRSLVPDYRAEEIADAARRHERVVQEGYAAYLSSAPDAHGLLAVVGTLALLRELVPESFQDDVPWSDIFSDRRFYRTDLVETPKMNSTRAGESR